MAEPAASSAPSSLPAGGPATDAGPDARELARAAGPIALVLALFFLPALLGPGQFLYRDSGRMHHPVKRWIASEWAAGRLPEWNPWAGLGAPVVAGAIDAVQHPFNLLLVLLPFEAAFKAWILLSYVLAALGGWIWSRRLGASPAAAVTAGLGFALSGFLVSSSDNATYLTTMAAVPWLLAAGAGFLARGGAGRIALVGAASYLCAAGGDPQAWGFAVAALALHAFVLGPRPAERRAALARSAVAVAAALVGAAPVIFPVAAFVLHSSRGESFDWVDYARFNLLPARLVELVVPHLFRTPELDIRSDLFQKLTGDAWTPMPWVMSEYLGAACAALAALGAWHRREARRLLLLAALLTWMAMGHWGGFGQLARLVPVLGGFRYWEKLAFWPALLVAAAAAFGIDALRSARPRFVRAAAAAAVLALALAGGCALAPEAVAQLVARAPEHLLLARQLAANLRDGLLESGLALALLAAAAALAALPSRARAAPALAAVILVADLAGANVRAYVLSPPELAAPHSPLAERLREAGAPRVFTPFPLGHVALDGLDRHEQAWLFGARAVYSGWNTGLRVGNFESYTALWPVRTARHRRRAGLVKMLPSVGLWGVSHVVVPGAPERAGEMNLPPPYRVAAEDPVLGAVLLEIAHRPRVYLAREVEQVDRRAAMEFALDPRSIAGERTVIEGPVPAGHAAAGGDARVVDESPTSVAIATRSTAPALLVLNDVFTEGWTATLDGEPATIQPANYLARGVWVPAGEHRVVFRYRTPLLREGWALLAAGACALALAALRGRRKGAARG